MESLEAFFWGFMDGDGEIGLRRYKKGGEYYVVRLGNRPISTFLCLEPIIESSGLPKDYKDFLELKLRRYAYGGLVIRSEWTPTASRELARYFNDVELDKIASKYPLPFLSGLFYAEGWVRLRFRVYPEKGVARGTIRSMEFKFKAVSVVSRLTSIRLEKCFTLLGIPYSFRMERETMGKWEVYSKSNILPVLKFRYCNFKCLPLLLCEGYVSVPTVVTASAIDYTLLPIGYRVGLRSPEDPQVSEVLLRVSDFIPDIPDIYDLFYRFMRGEGRADVGVYLRDYDKVIRFGELVGVKSLWDIIDLARGFNEFLRGEGYDPMTLLYDCLPLFARSLVDNYASFVARELTVEFYL